MDAPTREGRMMSWMMMSRVLSGRLVLAAMLVLTGTGALAQQGKPTNAISCATPPCTVDLALPRLGEPPPAPGLEAAGGGDFCRHMSSEERRKHPLTCGTAEPGGKAGAAAPAPAKSP
jgi:hypothetical protein